jgi:hypothetical protein
LWRKLFNFINDSSLLDNLRVDGVLLVCLSLIQLIL